MKQLFKSVGHAVPAALVEVITLGRARNKRAAELLASFDRGRPRTDRAINGRLAHL